ncbi:MAG TPA: hypothetical protein VMA13_00610 [Candidatus Saccharimonadales bacterium]|nr:hypothetical protein [Candidatus Saccharimonadales bacterium]
MKTKIVIALIAIAGMLGLAGCKPKQTTVAGQIFIVTQGAENVKLGDVEILLVDKVQVADFLRKKQSAIESEIESRQRELAVAKRALAEAQTNFDIALTNMSSDKAPAQLRLLSQMNTNEKLEQNLQRQIEALQNKDETILKNSALYSEADSDRANAIIKEDSDKIEALINQQTPLVHEDIALLERWSEEETNKLELAKSAVSTAEARLGSYPTTEDYFQDFSPAVTIKVISDAEGKFSFSYPRAKSFTIFASAQRMILGKTETYYWLVDAPTGATSAQILLSNNNLVYVDPDGYFKLKPKPSPQESIE